MQNHSYLRRVYLHKHQLYVWGQPSETFKFWSAIIGLQIKERRFFNKCRKQTKIIQLIGEYLLGKGCTVYNVDGDDDVLIVQTAIRLSEEMPTADGQLWYEYVKGKHNVFENVIVNNCIYVYNYIYVRDEKIASLSSTFDEI